jgi:NAD(P)-dependent dehydrogenase (short-subunit alcohol dehydrogenase family)
VALRRVQGDLTAQLGGPAEVTAAQALLIEQAAIKAVIVQAVERHSRLDVLDNNATGGGTIGRVAGPRPRGPGSARWR